jgi:hypothetical protein
MGEPQPERKIKELCTPDIIDLPILNLEDWKVVRDQDLNNPHGATFTLHR